ncbi:MAG: hypothetical protein LBN10_02775 [Propionibacteriaceae bacterium]|nr:hypothetical protein [Propionibacteriaceae bacterium]
MSTLTSIKVPIEVRNQLRDAAIRAGTTQSGLVEVLLNRFADELFWKQMEETSAQEYHTMLAADGDELNEDYTLEDALIDAEESSSLTGTKRRP